MRLNKPAKFHYNLEIKMDLFEAAKKLPKGSCVIDCGAHIGDGSIPLAHALKHLNREDIIIYAIDPSLYKCKFISKIAKLNNISNIRVLNYGLTDINTICDVKYTSSTNSGANIWIKNTNGTQFVTLDYLVERNIIEESIGVLHLDIEGWSTNYITQI